MYEVMRAAMKVLLPLIMRLRIVGREHFPAEPPYILAMNHLSIFDAPVLLITCPHTIRALAADKHKRNPIYCPLLVIMRAIWVRRGEPDREALRQALGVLKQKGVLGIAPEGTRSHEKHALQQGKVGVAYLATRADVPIVPIGIAGTEQVKRNVLRLRRTDVQVVVGKPQRLPSAGRVRSAQLEEYTELIMQRLAALLPEEYRGVYA